MEPVSSSSGKAVEEVSVENARRSSRCAEPDGPFPSDTAPSKTYGERPPEGGRLHGERHNSREREVLTDMGSPDSNRVTATAGDVTGRKSLVSGERARDTIEYTFESGRDVPIEMRLTDPLPRSVSVDDVEFSHASGSGVWRAGDGAVVFERWLDPEEEVRTSYRLHGIDRERGETSLTDPDLTVSSVGVVDELRLLEALPLWSKAVGVVVLGYLFWFLLQWSLRSAISGSGLGFGIAIVLALLIALAGGAWRVFEKAGYAGWKALVPIYNFYIVLKIGENSGWWLLGLLVPIVQFVTVLKMGLGVAREFGRSLPFGLGLVFLSPVFWPLLGFGDSRYQEADQRTEPEAIVTAVEWRGNLESPAFASATATALREESVSSLSVPKLQYALEAVEAYREVGAKPLHLEDARDSLESTLKRKAGTDRQQSRTA